jgi:hypothetical protein
MIVMEMGIVMWIMTIVMIRTRINRTYYEEKRNKSMVEVAMLIILFSMKKIGKNGLQ